MAIEAPRGTQDMLPAQSGKWHALEAKIRELCKRYGFREIRTPVFEHTELFQRGVGDTTDVVQKEMYTFLDKGERSITLKPEGTAGAARAYVQHAMFNEPQPIKLYYMTPVFRYEKPQAGRLREHHQFGVEVFGAPTADADAEVISLAWNLFQGLGLRNLTLHLNSIGCPKCRPQYHEALRAYLQEKLPLLCDTCNQRFEKNPLRILDCKSEICQAQTRNAPKSIDHLCPECREHLAQLEARLEALGIRYEIDPYIVRGLDYYTKTVFEIISPDIGAQATVCGGGRYDGLIETVGGPATPGMGFGMGLERLLLALESLGIEIDEPCGEDVYVATMGEAAKSAGMALAKVLRDRGLRVETDLCGRSFKAQFKYATKQGARFVATIGDNELAAGAVRLKNMETGEQREIPLITAGEAIEREVRA